MNDQVSERVLVACIGNIFLGDDGFGVQVASELARAEMPIDAMVVDYGIRALDLAYALLKPWRAVILIDAIARGGAPGELYLLQSADETQVNIGLDPHAMDPQRVLNLARSLGEVTAPVYILGCEPLDFGDELEGRMGLSLPVAAAVPRAASMVRRMFADKTADATFAGIAGRS